MSNGYVYKDILIANTRTGGENANILCAVNNGHAWVPQLQVNNSPTLPANCRWNIGWVDQGAQFTVEFLDPYGNAYRLALPSDIQDGTLCLLVAEGQSGYCTSWAFPYPTRMLSGYGSGLHPYEGTQGTMSLDSGKYPNPVAWTFNSSVNQTWQYGYDINDLKPMPF
ncbi:hypothetical protein [Nocardia sp. NPDC020380]|uniref:hypothetical protein n=1 Tax=Nocardia sp. NPDC020380 TaxID=3364309 RepID=UPI0037ADBBC4